MMRDIRARGETQDDHDAICCILGAAFGRADEARLVDRLRADGGLVM